MEIESCVPPGFRFHPTEEELVGYYLKKKINSLKIDLDVIVDIDLYRMEPWEIQDKCKMGYDEQNEWYFFSHKDKKYPTGTRTNRATAAGFWKATGRDKAVLSKNRIIGMRKTLVFYKGRAPNGKKSDWIMHEYRLQTSEHAPPQEEGWVVCRAFKKPTPNHRQGFEAWAHAQYANCRNNNVHAMAPLSFSDMVSPMQSVHSNQTANFHQEAYGFTPNPTDDRLVELPKLDSPSLSTSLAMKEVNIEEDCDDERSNNGSQYIDWKQLDDLLASQPGETTSYSHPSAQLHEMDAQNHASHHGHFLGWDPNF